MRFQSSQSFWLIIMIVLMGHFHQLCSGQKTTNDCGNKEERRLETIMLNQNQAILSLQKLIEHLREEVSDIASSLSQNLSGHHIPCPPGFVYRPCVNSCYKVILEPLTWDQSQARCAKEYPGAHAAVVSSAEEDKVIVEYLKSFNSTAKQACGVSGGFGFYTSGQRAIPEDCSTTFVWKQNFTTTLPLTYTNWRSSQPDCHKFGGLTYESCLQYFDLDYKWNDISCEVRMCALCQVDK